jgi:chromosome segregation ATPase
LEAEQAKAALVAQVDANNAMKTALQDVIDAIDANYTLADYAALISDLESANVTLAASIEAKKAEIAIGEITVDGISNDIEALETEIAALEEQIVIQQALADKYKALMEAALAS